jgi:hypothetical protein
LREAGSDKFKQKKAEWLSLAFFYFSESGLFKGLRAKNQKSFDLCLRLYAKRLSTDLFAHAASRWTPTTGVDPAIRNRYTPDF